MIANNMRCGIEHTDKVLRVLLNKEVIKLTSDDGDSNKEAMEAGYKNMLMSPKFYVLMPDNDTVFVLVPINNITYDIHIAVLKGDSRKNVSHNMLKMGAWVLINTSIRKITAHVPSYSRAVISLSEDMGMSKEGCLKSAYLKDGVLHDLFIFGITDEEMINRLGD